ncbi:MAG TPA: Kazal-type serine protease inhibitor domain-containing protein [Candidatus Limnocylindria bacterium]|nr:Kazal-type serine protease inhibitor domain-containing protein [Candidatus Limnocylindria bacterium]
MARAFAPTVALLATLLASGQMAAAKGIEADAFHAVATRCPCPGPSPDAFWASPEERAACIATVLGEFVLQGLDPRRAARLVRHARRARCGRPRLRCNGTAAMPCRPALVCQVADPSCRPEGVAGICVRPPTGCARQPACGCDGRTYASPCALTRAGMTLAHLGSCTTMP